MDWVTVAMAVLTVVVVADIYAAHQRIATAERQLETLERIVGQLMVSHDKSKT
jgi:hypothetical protein